MTAPTLLHDLLDAPAVATPDAPALTRGAETWSYAELARRSRAVTGWLTGHGIGRGDRVAVVGHNELAVVAALFGISRAGAVFVLVSDQVPATGLRHILTDSGARIVLGNDAAGPLIAEAGVIPADRLEEAVAAADRADDAAGPPCLSVDPVCLIYTSGSTALPKAVVSTHRHVFFAATAIADRLGYRAGDTVFSCLPFSFDYGLYQIFLSGLAGARLVVGDDADAGPALVNRLIAERATVLPLVPSLAATLCRLIARGGRIPGTLRMATNTGADLSAGQCARLREAIPGLQVYAMFGLTECKRISIAEPDLDLTRPGSVGLALRDTEVWIADESGERVPAGTVGELVVRGPHVMAGYWNAPDLTARRFRRDELGAYVLYTGDRARVDEDGYLYFVGRDDDVFKQHGFRVSAIEIEAAALTVPAVETAACLPARDGETARLAVTGDLTVAELLAGLHERLEPPKIPPRCQVVERLPLSVNGKIDKKALAAGWDAVTAAAAEVVG